MPFLFLQTSGWTPEEVRNGMIMAACQIIMSEVRMAVSEVMCDNKIWLTSVSTDFQKSAIWPICSGILFWGSGRVEEDGKNIIQPFAASFIVDPKGVDSGLLEASLNDPDGFLRLFPQNYRWFHGGIIHL